MKVEFYTETVNKNDTQLVIVFEKSNLSVRKINCEAITLYFYNKRLETIWKQKLYLW